jgi:hypothetical protein
MKLTPCSKRDGKLMCCMHCFSCSYSTKECSSTSRCCFCGETETFVTKNNPAPPPEQHGPYIPIDGIVLPS